MNDELLYFIKLTSIIAATAFGIAGTATETKKNDGSLTKWGIIALIGVILTNSFQYTQTYLEQKKERIKQQEEKDEKLQEAISKERQAKVDKANFEKQLSLLYSNINKSDTSLEKQIAIQNDTREVLGELNKSIDIQKRVSAQSELIAKNQLKANHDLDVTLNPLFPFKIRVDFKLNVNKLKEWKYLKEFDKKLLKLTEEIQGDFNHISEFDVTYNGIEGWLLDEDEPWWTGTYYTITRSSPYYKKFWDLFAGVNFHMEISKKEEDFDRFFLKKEQKTVKSLRCSSHPNFFTSENLIYNLNITYYKRDATYEISIDDIPMDQIWESYGFNSTNDMKDTRVTLECNYISLIDIDWIRFKCPPNFSTFKRMIGKETEPYSYQRYSFLCKSLQ